MPMVNGRNVIMSGLFDVKEILIRTIEDSLDFPIMVENKSGEPVYGVIKEYAYQKFRIGEMIAYKEESTSKIFIGWAICLPCDMEKGYSKELGRIEATKKADSSFDSPVNVPHFIREDLTRFIDRVMRYFGKDCKDLVIPEWATKLYKKYNYVFDDRIYN